MKLLLMMMKFVTPLAPGWQLSMQDQLTRLDELFILLYFFHNRVILQDHVKVIRISISRQSVYPTEYKVQLGRQPTNINILLSIELSTLLREPWQHSLKQVI